MAIRRQEPRRRLLTPTFRVAFPYVFVKRAFEGHPEASGRYACVALFSGFEVVGGVTSMRAPPSWSEQDRAKWNALIAICNDIALAAFKRPMEELSQVGAYRLPFHRGEEKELEGFGPGIVYFTMSAKNRRPGIVARDGITPITQYGPDEFYSGCYARASVTPFANTRWKSIAIGMNNLQKLADGPRLDDSNLATDDFGADPAES